MNARALTMVACMGGMFGCATVSAPPHEELARSEILVKDAELTAPTTGKAADHLVLAREEIAEARALMSKNLNDEARLATLRASADARLAMALTEQQRNEAAAKEAARELDSAQGGQGQSTKGTTR
jgi:hypothetical protein